LQQTRRSKLEMYVDILKVLADNGLLKQTNIMSQANLNSNILRDRMSFLIKYQLIEEQTIKKRRTVFAITQKGINVLRYFRELEQISPIME
jgi:predicted transcriptional regulator